MIEDFEKIISMSKEQIEFTYNCKVLAFYRYRYTSEAGGKVYSYNVLRYIKDGKHYHITFDIVPENEISSEELNYIPPYKYIEKNYLNEKSN